MPCASIRGLHRRINCGTYSSGGCRLGLGGVLGQPAVSAVDGSSSDSSVNEKIDL